MSYVVKINGHDVLCETAADVHALLGSTPHRGGRTMSASGSSSGPRATSASIAGGRHLDTAKTFLSAITAQPKGITSRALVEALGFKGPKALGGALGYVHAYLKEMGLEPEQVYETQKRSDAKYWIPLDKAQNALMALEAK